MNGVDYIIFKKIVGITFVVAFFISLLNLLASKNDQLKFIQNFQNISTIR